MVAKKKVPADLPPGVVASDLSYPDSYRDFDPDTPYEQRQMEFWQVVRVGWCIPTIDIGKVRGQAVRRTYAVRIDNGAVVRIGGGPHVLQTLTVYVRRTRKAALQKYVDLKLAGMADAGSIRDRISSRRAQGQLERMAGRQSWRWNS